MYYEIKTINRILCWRGSPDDDFTEFSKEQLSSKLSDAEAKIEDVRNCQEFVDVSDDMVEPQSFMLADDVLEAIGEKPEMTGEYYAL